MTFSVDTNDPVKEGSNSLKESDTVGAFAGSFARKTPVTGDEWSAHLYWLTGWDVSTGTHNQSHSTLIDNSPNGIFFRSDGKKMYVAGNDQDNVYEYDLSTAWDVTSASLTNSEDISGQDTLPQDVFFRSDGKKMYLIGLLNDNVYEYDLSTAWDVTTKSFNQSADISDGGNESSPTGVFFRDDGDKMYVSGNDSGDIYEYNLSTSWDVSTASLNQSFSLVQGGVAGVFLRSDGKKMYTAGDNTAIHEYDLSTAWDISTASLGRSLDIGSNVSFPRGVFFREKDGEKMYVPGSHTDAIHEYDLSDKPSTVLVWGHDTEASLGNGYGLGVRDNGGLQTELLRFDSGTPTVLASSTSLPPRAEWFEVKLTHETDGTLTVDFGGVTLSTTDSTHLDADGRYVGHGIGYWAPGGVLGNAVDDWSQLLTVVEDWESGDLTAWPGGNTADFEVTQADPVSQPLHSLKVTSDTSAQISSREADGTRKPAPGDVQEMRVWIDSSAVGTNGEVSYFWASDIRGDGFGDNHYRVDLSDNSGAVNDSVFRVAKRVDFTDTTIASTVPSSIPNNVWLTIRVEHETDGSMTAQLLDEDGTVLETISGTDSAHITDGEYDQENIAIRNTIRENRFDAWIIR